MSRPTDAGEALAATLRPAFADIENRIEALSSLGQRAAGTIRITSGQQAAETILSRWPNG